MPDTSLIFPTEEYRNRITRLQSQMAHARLDALLLTTAPDVFYATGFLTRFWESPARPWYIVIPLQGPPTAVIPSIGAALMARTWIRDIRTWQAPNPQDTGVTLLAETLQDMTSPTGRIGLPMGLETHLRMPLADYHALTGTLGPDRFADATDCLQRVREIKSEAELHKIKAACNIAAQAFEQVPEFAKHGTPLDNVFRQFQMACLQAGADWVSYVAGGAGQNGYDDVISPAPATPLEQGDILMLDTGVVHDGYFCDYDRNYAIGPAGDAAKRAHDALWLATEETLAAIRPGQRACDVHAMLCQSLIRHGAKPASGRLGHGLGVSLTEWPSISPHDATPLREGMALTLEPAVVSQQGRIMVHEENFVLRADGAELLSPRAPQTLPEIT